MTEIERYNPSRGDPARSQLDSWVAVWAPVVQLAEHVHATDFVPNALRGNAPATAAAMLYGRELGMGPMRSLQTVHMVDGRPTLSAEQMRAMVLASGHEISFRETTKARCTVAGRRCGQTSYTTVTWTLDDARAMNLTHKQNWRRSPRQMLVARASAELCRMIFADIIGGASATEELWDGAVADPTTDPAPDPAPRRTVRRTTAVRQTPPAHTAATPPEQPDTDTGPPLPHEITDDTDDTTATDDDGITDGQLTRLQAIFTTHDITDRDDRLHIARTVVGRDLASSKELTRREAAALIDVLHHIEHQTGDDDFRVALDALLSEMDVLASDLDRGTDASSDDPPPDAEDGDPQ